ncbi:MAG: bifunctional diaminohydroxyphosphoribosylaminopyrimidine deaminase/5-amino-6-(5-phosphoribosylamino)uracil reductase RibD [Aestuariibacter sp.]
MSLSPQASVTVDARDAEMMARAIQLAKKGRFTTSPNPNVGCVITNSKGHIVGEGFHFKAGLGHAEVNALAQAKSAAQDGTAYVTLEPCSHFGRTPPCANALIEAGVKRVVVAMQDPNPKVAGKGFKLLQDAGIEVQCGVLASQAIQLNKGFVSRFEKQRPYVTVKLAMSLDGRIALKNGISQWITGPQARQDVQRHRAEACAILTGSGTVLSDDPSLNVRYQELGYAQSLINDTELRQPARIIIDSKNQLPDTRKLYHLPGSVTVFNTRHNPNLPGNITQWQTELDGGKINLAVALSLLAEQQYNHIWVEAGARLAGALLAKQLVDELIVYVAPKLLGHEGRELVYLQDIVAMEQCQELRWQQQMQVGNDLKLVAVPIYKPQ